MKQRKSIVDHDPRRLVESGYDRIAQRYLEFAQRSLERGKPSTARMNYLQKLLERLPAQAQVLELGCGAGVPCTQILAKQAHLMGVDISAAQIELARQHVPNATLFQADMMTLEFPPATFDAIVAQFYGFAIAGIGLPTLSSSMMEGSATYRGRRGKSPRGRMWKGSG